MKKHLFKKFQKGTSLIELLVYLGLLTIVLVVAINIFINAGEFGLKSAAKNTLQEDARFIINRLSYDIHQANSITTPANLGDTTSTLTLTLGSETHSYTLNGTNIEYQRLVVSPPINQTANLNSNLTKVNSLSFKRLGNSGGKPTIKITFSLQPIKNPKGNPMTETFETVVSLR